MRRSNQDRAAALLAAEAELARAARLPRLQYSATVTRLRKQFEADMAAALAELVTAVRPAQRAYNCAVIAAERAWSSDERPASGVDPHGTGTRTAWAMGRSNGPARRAARFRNLTHERNQVREARGRPRRCG